MKDIILGEIRKDGDNYFTKITYLSNIIEINIDLGGETLEKSIKVTQELVSSIVKFDNLSKEILARDLLAIYNGGWNSYDETQEDGSTISVTNPNLSKDEFISKLTLSSIYVMGDGSISLSYDDSDMFWGHQPTVSSDDGFDFSKAQGNI